ncbi:cathepsin L1-like [Mizuhopecten yessoensis]|uniref:Cathepsin L1 n=1 Tax=Mizuhopecten yessoensis TaxID=6573 RepID=A0A210QXG8_MIZYE|nr:cathepsin L1-like [Mizuhopecten yessoensis]OWF53459.1 Cathepsin L1 [Mizuhopecten yessoensis]
MLKLALLSVLYVCAIATPLTDPILDDEWTLFKNTYNRQYEGQEELMRRIIWEDNARFVQRHNVEASNGLHTFTTGMNEFGDLTNLEFVSMMNGYIMRNSTSNLVFDASKDTVTDDTVDWRTKGYVTEVKNQGQCGSCWAFSTTGSLEGQHFKKEGKLVSLSEQNLVDCSKKQGNHGCQGGLMDFGFKYIKENKGIDTEESYPYRAKNGKCKFEASNVGATDTGFVDVKSKSVTALQQAVSTIGPISIAMDASHRSFQMYKTGTYKEPKCSSTKLDHGVLAVGYGTEGSTDYWIIKNSWGKSWGMDGYFQIVRSEANMCGIATQPSYPTV